MNARSFKVGIFVIENILQNSVWLVAGVVSQIYSSASESGG
jgi:hypothetical protein